MMKQLVMILMMAVILGFSVNEATAQKKTEVVCYKSNMDCANCEKTLTEYLKFEKGVKDLKVDFVSNTIKVEYKTGKNDSEGVAKAIKKKGYVAEEITLADYKKITGKKDLKQDHSTHQQEKNQ